MTRLEQIAKSRQELASERPELIRQVTAMREEAVAKLPEMLARAKETLEGKLATVYFVEDSAEAARILGTLLGGERQVSRSYSSTLAEIGFDAIMAERGIKVNLTRLEEIVQQQMGLPPTGHPHLLILDQPREVIEEGLRRFAGCKDGTATDLKRQVSEKIKADVVQSEFGITGLDCIVAEHGSMVLAEDEGNLRAVSNLPYKHVVVAGLEQLVPTAEEAVALVQAASIFSTGRLSPTYISFISGPSRTGDIEFRMALGMHGPKEVHVILLDNGRRAIRDGGASSLLKCIDCGSCYESCAKLAGKQGWQNVTLTPKGLALGIAQATIDEASGKGRDG